jgi:large repetitive protein
MKKLTNHLSLFLSIILVLQLLIPVTKTLGAELDFIPKNLTATMNTITDVTLTWDQVSGAKNYRVYRLDGDKRILLGQPINNIWSINSSTQAVYTVVVTSIKDGRESELSTPVYFEIKFPEIVAPVNITYSIFNINDIQLKWDSVPYASYYRIYQITNEQKKLVATTTSTTRNFTGVAEGEYTYEISAGHGLYGESTNNNRIVVKMILPKLKAPQGLTYEIFNGNDLKLSWQAVEYASGYKIYQIVNNERRFITSTTNRSTDIQNLVEGEYVFEVSAISGIYGESIENNKINISIVYPIMEVPLGLKYISINPIDIELSWQPVEYATSYKIYQTDNNEKKLIGYSTSVSKKITNLPAGSYKYSVSAVSNRFGESLESDSINVDIVYPEIKAPEGLTATLEGISDVKLSWRQTQYANSYKIYENINDEKKLLYTTAGISKIFLGLEEGQHTFEVATVNNLYGESTETARVTIEIIYPKLVAPETVIEKIENGNVNISWTNVNYATSYNVYRVLSNDFILIDTVASKTYNVENLSEGEHRFAVSANTSFGESPYSNIVLADISMELEAPSSQTPVVNGDKVELNWSAVTGAATYNIYKVEDEKISLVTNTQNTNITIEDLTPGNYEFRIVPVSTSGIEGEEYTTVPVEINQTDTTPPQTVANESTNWLQDAYEVKLIATDDQSGVAQTFYSINGSEFTEGTSFTVIEEGVNTVSFYSIDNSGNVEEVKTTEVKIDKTAPVTKSNIATNWTKGKVTVNLTATDDLSGVAKSYYSIDGSAYIEGNKFTISTEGITQVSFYSVDNAGNKEAAKIEEVMIDNTAPVTKSDITDQWNSDAVKVDLTATDNLSGVAKTYYSINGSEYLEGNSFTVTGEGVIQVSFYSVDNAGNEEAVKTEFVKLDNQAPETVSDFTDKWNTGDVTVNLTATDNESGVATTFYSINGSEFVEGTEITVNQEGINKVSFYSVDNVGNVEVVKTVDVKVDKTAPTTTSDFTDKWNKDQVAVKLTATDELSGVANTYYSINGTDYVEGTQFTVSQEGINKVSFYSVDNAGNIEDVQTVEVKVDKTAPVVSWNLADQYALGDSLPLAYKATDEHSGIAKETISVNGKVYENTNSVKLDKPGTYEVVVTVTDHAGWTTTIEKTIEVYIPATLIVNPGVIKANAGDFTVKISLPKGYNTNQIDLSTATLNGVSAKSGTNGLVQQAKNGQFKFNRDDFEWKKGMVTVEFRVLVDGILVIGSTTVEVK